MVVGVDDIDETLDMEFVFASIYWSWSSDAALSVGMAARWWRTVAVARLMTVG